MRVWSLLAAGRLQSLHSQVALELDKYQSGHSEQRARCIPDARISLPLFRREAFGFSLSAGRCGMGGRACVCTWKDSSLNIAYTMAPGRGDTDLLLARFAEGLAERGVRLCGTVQINTDNAECNGCDMDVQVLPDGPVIRISQSLGRDARGCRLDPAALEQAVGLAAARLEQGADLLIVNKFGKHEAAGGGYRGLIAEALERNIPVLVGLNKLNEAAFSDYTGGLGQGLPPEEAALWDWARMAVMPGLDAFEHRAGEPV
jgi:nucleoside-triphosphatase THEP1